MISKYFGSRILVLGAVGAALVGCDSVKDVTHVVLHAAASADRGAAGHRFGFEQQAPGGA